MYASKLHDLADAILDYWVDVDLGPTRLIEWSDFRETGEMIAEHHGYQPSSALSQAVTLLTYADRVKVIATGTTLGSATHVYVVQPGEQALQQANNEALLAELKNRLDKSEVPW